VRSLAFIKVVADARPKRSGSAGSLGLGDLQARADRQARGDEPGEMGDNLPPVELRF
jgi:hypothetical protein